MAAQPTVTFHVDITDFVEDGEEFKDGAWPEGISRFILRDALPYPLPVGTSVFLSSKYVGSLDGEISSIEYSRDENEIVLRLSMKPSGIDVNYFLDPKNGWVGER